MVCLGRPCHFKFFKGCLQQIFTWSIHEYLNPYAELLSDTHAEQTLGMNLRIRRILEYNVQKKL